MPSPFEIADAHIAHVISRSPMLSTQVGEPGADDRWDDLSLESRRALAEHHERVLAQFGPHRDHEDFDQRICARVMSRHLGDQLASFEAGDHFVDVRHMAATFHRMRGIFDVMDSDTERGWAAIIRRLESIDEPLQTYAEVLRAGVAQGRVAARRQVEAMLSLIDNLATSPSSFDNLPRRLATSGCQIDGLDDAIATAKTAVARFGEALRSDYLPHAPERDAVGAEAYRRHAGRFVGMDVDPAEAYDWGWHELGRLLDEASAVAKRIEPGSTFDSVKDLLDNDPARAATTPDEFVSFVEERQHRALAELDGVHFDVPDPVRSVTVAIAPPGGPLSAYYLRPSEDFTRPGGIWFSIGDQTFFPLYHWVSTAYHEGFPGHHLQIGTAMANRTATSRAQRIGVFYPGYSEGWALYAERLMGELGYLEKPEYEFGMLAKHLYRATRVVVDIGLHLELELPPDAPLHPGERWTFDIAVEYMRAFAFRTAAQAPNEVLRYLGWPGQAIAYKLGEREILRVREQAGNTADHDLKTFHARVLGHGTLPLELLDEVVLGRR